VRATLAVNRELILLYWSVGRDILANQQEVGWDAKIIDQSRPESRIWQVSAGRTQHVKGACFTGSFDVAMVAG